MQYSQTFNRALEIQWNSTECRFSDIIVSRYLTVSKSHGIYLLKVNEKNKCSLNKANIIRHSTFFGHITISSECRRLKSVNTNDRRGKQRVKKM